MREEEFEDINSVIRKRLIKEGKLGRKPFLRWSCDINVEIHDPEYENKFKSGLYKITIGDGSNTFDRLIERCVETMYLNEKSLFILKSVEDANDLNVTVTLESFVEKPYIFEWTDEEKVKELNYLKHKGTELFKENKIEEAFYKFSNALKLLITLNSVLENDEPGTDLHNVKVALYNNIARCHLHFKNYPYVIELCSTSINICCSSKALYRRALAFIELKEYEKAENDLIALLKLEPKNKAAIEKYKLVRELDKKNRENYQAVMKKMFQPIQ